MKKSLFSILAVLALAVPALAEEKPKFVLSDGYFQVDGRQPSHLTHGMPAEKKVELGSGFKLWLSIKLNEGATSPCGPRDKEPCYYEMRLSPPGVAKEAITDWDQDDFRVKTGDNGSSTISLGYPVTREALAGHRVLYYRIRYGTAVEYIAEIPIEVAE